MNPYTVKINRTTTSDAVFFLCPSFSMVTDFTNFMLVWLAGGRSPILALVRLVGAPDYEKAELQNISLMMKINRLQIAHCVTYCG